MIVIDLVDCEISWSDLVRTLFKILGADCFLLTIFYEIYFVFQLFMHIFTT